MSDILLYAGPAAVYIGALFFAWCMCRSAKRGDRVHIEQLRARSTRDDDRREVA